MVNRALFAPGTLLSVLYVVSCAFYLQQIFAKFRFAYARNRHCFTVNFLSTTDTNNYCTMTALL